MCWLMTMSFSLCVCLELSAGGFDEFFSVIYSKLFLRAWVSIGFAIGHIDEHNGPELLYSFLIEYLKGIRWCEVPIGCFYRIR